MNRLIVIGLDGASPDLVKAWQESLPNLRNLMIAGSAGTLHSTIPPRSVPAWYSLIAGVNPAKLGVFGFSQRLPKSYDYTFANFSHCRAAPFWYWLGKRGMRSAIVHVPGTYPPAALNGTMVSGWPMPLNRGNLTYTYPKALSRRIDAVLGHPFEAVSAHDIKRDNDQFMLGERLRILRMHGDVARMVLMENEWQVAMVVLSPIDRASHQFWRHFDADHPRHDAAMAKLMRGALRQVYEATDLEVGRLLELVDVDDFVFVVSDHGFGPCHRTFYLNEWLRQQGYLVLRDDQNLSQPSVAARILARLAKPLFRLNEESPLFRRVTAPFKRGALSNFVRDRYLRVRQKGRVRLNHVPVDWSKTRAYCPDESSLYLNLRGRDPQGIVSPGAEAERLVQEIEVRLRNVVNPQTGRPSSTKVWRKEDIYSGPFLHDAPELTLAMDDFQTNVMAELAHGELFDEEPLWSGNHTAEGIIIARGPGIRAGCEVNAEIVDVTPTILHIMDGPVPADADGKVLLEMFQEDSDIRCRPVQVEDEDTFSSQTYDLTESERADVEKQLKGLGYIE